MPSKEQTKLASKRLAHWLDNEKRLVTYREISRELGCHVNVAKNLLLQYYQSHSSLTPTYLLTGPLKSESHIAQTQFIPSAPASPGATQSLAHLSATQGGVRIVDMDEMSDADRNSEHDDEEDPIPGNDAGAEDGLGLGNVRDTGDDYLESEAPARWGVVLAQGDMLDEKRKLFEEDELSIHIYALAPTPIKDPGMYLVPNLALRSHKAYHEPAVYGTIAGDGFNAKATAMKDGAMDFSKPTPVTSKADAKKTAETKVEKEKEKKAEKPVKQEAAALKPEKRETTPKPLKAAEKKQARGKRVIQSDDEDEAVPAASTSKTSPVEPTSSMNRADDAAAMAAMMDMDMDGDLDMSDGVSPVKKKAEEVKVKTEPGTKKRKRVKTTEMFVNEKGYNVTRDVWKEVSGSESEGEGSASPARPVPRKSTSDTVKKTEPAKAPAKPLPKPAAGPGMRGQSTLAGFFKKK